MIKQPARTHHPRDRYLPNVAVECAKRWKQCLDPQLDRSEWTEDDVCLNFSLDKNRTLAKTEDRTVGW
jgi:hypothetical protein